MVKFAHLADCHLGGWRQDELQKLNFESFQKAVEICIKEKVDFILIAGDLFDSAYPPIEILRDSFAEFRKIKEAGIPVYIIAGSHDFSASGKTFLEVLAGGGFVKNIEKFEVKEDGTVLLKPEMIGDIALFGYSGKKSGMEIDDLRKVKFDSVYGKTIFMIHTTIKDVVGNIPMDSIEKTDLPLADYYAMGHIHQVFYKKDGGVFSYPGPVYPNNFQELVDLKQGSFNLVEFDGEVKCETVKIKSKDVVYIEIEIDNGLIATERVIDALDKHNLNDKIVLLKLTGTLVQGKSGDIRFNELEDFVKKKGAYIFLRNISSLKVKESGMEINADNVENLEEEIVKDYMIKHKSDFSKFVPQLMDALSIDKNEDEKSVIFENRLLGEVNKILGLELG